VHWVIRWTDTDTDQDMAVVVEAATRDEAQAVAAARGLPTIFVARACKSDLADARRAQLLLTCANTTAAAARVATGVASAAARYTVLGRPLGHGQLAALMFLGVATAMLHLAPVLRPILG
jgi:hypothetical protein